MIKTAVRIIDVKEKIEKLKDKSVTVRVNLGRNKESKFVGVLTNVYPSLFTVKPDDIGYIGKTSYSYAEYICGKVKLKENVKD